MAIEFILVPGKKVNIAELLVETQQTIQELLNLTSPPEIHIQGWDNNYGRMIGEVGENFTFEVKDVAEANLAFFNLPSEADPFQKEINAVISAGGFRTEESVVLALTIAIALGRKTRSPIINESLLLSSKRIVDPEEILQSNRLSEEQKEFVSACHLLFTQRIDLI